MFHLHKNSLTLKELVDLYDCLGVLVDVSSALSTQPRSESDGIAEYMECLCGVLDEELERTADTALRKKVTSKEERNLMRRLELMRGLRGYDLQRGPHFTCPHHNA
ncbi:hypothetical protein [Polycladidibacter hongkongensis]|uniref:hypothetical protein n=1 Tax=Polycladidibacter hongkongensis TaxID=1647556 RepID=UPI000835FB41|nr:hypothetical protein [Pseudovibrio hongkongensis]